MTLETTEGWSLEPRRSWLFGEPPAAWPFGGFASPWIATMPVDGVPDAEPGTDSAVLTNTVLFKAGGEIGVIVEVMNVVGKFVALVSVELTKVLITGDALDENGRVVIVPDSITIVSLQVVSIEKDDVDESVTTVVVPDCVRVDSLHVSIDDGDGAGSEENVTTVAVPDCVIVLSLHVVSQTNTVLGAMEDEPIKLRLVIVGNEGVTVVDITVHHAGFCEEVPVNGPDVDRAEGALLDNSPEGADDWPLVPLIELIPATDEVLLGIPEGNGMGLVSEPWETDDVGGGMVRLPLKLVTTSADEVLYNKLDENGPVLGVDTISEAELGLVMITTLVMLADGKEVALVKFERGYEPEVKLSLEMTGTLVLSPELVPKIDPLEPDESEDAVPVAEIDACEVEVGPVTWVPQEISSVLGDGPGVGTMVRGNVSTIVAKMVVSTVAVNVFPVTVMVEIVNVSIDDKTSVMFAVPELNAELGGPGGLLDVVEFVTGYGAEVGGHIDMAEELPLALVRLVPEEDSEAGEIPEEVSGIDVTIDVGNPPLGTDVGPMRLDELVAGKRGVLDDGPPDSVGPPVATVEFENGYGPVEEPIMDPDGPVDNGGPVPGTRGRGDGFG
ncbi:hypothetical protein F4824DRAFT_516146 [Ustulina deusta]|nr:hypothetical protein F4824DRAFT_516146 [Ustulina deusta]